MTEEMPGGNSLIQVRIVADRQQLETALRRLTAGLPVGVTVDCIGSRPKPEPYARWLPVPENGGRTRYVKVEEIDWIESERQYVRLHAGNRTFLTRGPAMTITKLAARLDPARFIRVHRSYVVNLDRVEALRTDGSPKRYVVLVGGQDVPVSQSHWKKLQDVLGKP